jgi:hypothetical protein
MIVDKIRNYLQCGGLFNPEMMDHKEVCIMIQEALKIIKLQDQRIENLLKAGDFYSNISTTMQTEAALLVRDGFQGDFYPIQLKAREALARDKELTKEK